jgi:hypothetical protein
MSAVMRLAPAHAAPVPLTTSCAGSPPTVHLSQVRSLVQVPAAFPEPQAD